MLSNLLRAVGLSVSGLLLDELLELLDLGRLFYDNMLDGLHHFILFSYAVGQLLMLIMVSIARIPDIIEVFLQLFAVSDADGCVLTNPFR